MRTWLLNIFLLSAHLSFAQRYNYTFTNYSTANGLADNPVSSILQDSRGFMWFGTREGLSRFDGINFKNFFAGKNDSTALPGNNIAFLHEYQPGMLLMTATQILTRMNTVTRQFSRVSQLGNKFVFSLNRISPQRFGISILDTCFIMNDRLELIDTIVPPLRHKTTVPVITALDDNIWLIGTTEEYFFYDLRTKIFSPFAGGDFSGRDNKLNFHYYDSKNKWLYFSNYHHGLFRYTAEGTILYNWKRGITPGQLPDANISFIMPKNDSILWIGCAESGGLIILNTFSNSLSQVSHNSSISSSLAGNGLFSCYTDRDNNEWLATAGGLSKQSGATGTISSWRESFPGISGGDVLLNVIKGSEGNIYVSAFGSRRSYKINPKTDRISSLDENKLPYTWCLARFQSELIFTGGAPFITRFNPVTGSYRQTDFLKKYFPASDVIILALKHSNGDEWYSGNNGGGFVRVGARDGVVHHYRKDGPRGNFSISYYANYAEDKNGDLWFGVNKSNKLLRWSLTKDMFNEVSFDTMKALNGVILSGITDMTMDHENNLWISFDGSGIIKYNARKNQVVHYTIQDGMPTNYAYVLKFDDRNRLWIGTIRGLSCLLVNENRFVNFTREDGLPADFFDERTMYYDSAAHQLWAGSKNTLMRFDPDALLATSGKRFPLFIDEIIVNGKNYTGENYSDISFSPQQNNLQFRFIALDISSGKDIEYSYMLSGADKDWIYNSNIQTASYANLAPGKYRFNVRARHKGDTGWKQMEQSLNFIIATPWNKTWWFRLFLIAALSSLTWLFIRSYYRRKLEKEKALLEKQQAVEKERTRIATDMHDDFGASLSRIKFISEKIQVTNTGDNPLNADLQKISAYSDEMAEKMNEIVWALNQRYDSLEDLVSFSRAYAADYLQDKNIQLHFFSACTVNKMIQGEVRRNLFMVIKECLHNIVKHAQARNVSIRFAYTDKLLVEIKDDGRGIDLDAIRPFANGLENMKKRIAEINGNFSILKEKGTVVQVETGL